MQSGAAKYLEEWDIGGPEGFQTSPFEVFSINSPLCTSPAPRGSKEKTYFFPFFRRRHTVGLNFNKSCSFGRINPCSLSFHTWVNIPQGIESHGGGGRGGDDISVDIGDDIGVDIGGGNLGDFDHDLSRPILCCQGLDLVL